MDIKELIKIASTMGFSVDVEDLRSCLHDMDEVVGFNCIIILTNPFICQDGDGKLNYSEFTKMLLS